MEDLLPFLTSLLSHWFLLTLAVVALGLYLFYDFGDNSEGRMIAAVIFVASMLGAIYLTVSERFAELDQTLNRNRPVQKMPANRR